MKTKTGSINLDYSSNSLRDEKEKDKRLRTCIDRILIRECEKGSMSWDSDPVEVVNFVKEMNKKHGMNIPVDKDDIRRKLRKRDERIKRMSKVYQQIQKQKICKKLRSSRKQHDSDMDMTRNCNVVGNPNIQEPTEDQMNSDTTTRSTSIVVENPNQEDVAMENPNQEDVAMENPNREDGEMENPNQEDVAVENPNQEMRQMVRFTSRQLTKTDVDPHQHRLAMPQRQVDDRLIRKDEREKMKEKGIPAKLRDPQNRVHDICLKIKSTQGSSFSYAIGKPWNEIREINGFKENMTLNVLYFRGEGNQLNFVLQRQS